MQSLSKNEMEKLSWILDKWAGKDGESTSYETWIRINDNLYEGSSETIKTGDTTFLEKLKIEKTGDGIFYTADVKHNPKPVSFKLIQISDIEAVFENSEHDFPQKISYRNEDGKLHAWIEGPGKKGKWQKIDFCMSKIR